MIDDQDAQVLSVHFSLQVDSVHLPSLSESENDFRANSSETVRNTVLDQAESTPNSSLQIPESQESDVTPNGNVSDRVPAMSDQLHSRQPPLKQIARSWIRAYESCPSEGLKSIVELILHTTGYRDEFEMDMITTLTIPVFDSWMGRPNTKPCLPEDVFHGNLSKLIKLMLNENVLLDEGFMKTIDNLLKVLVNSSWRSSRYIALVYGSEITELILKLKDKIENEQINDVVPPNQLKTDFVNMMIKQFSNKVMLCLIDHETKIRKLAFTVFMEWLEDYPQIFVQDEWLRYIYWATVDDNAFIRALAIKKCSSLITSDEYTGRLNAFTLKCLPSLINRTCDVNISVALAALKSLLPIYRKCPVLFKDEMFLPIYELCVFGEHPAISSASGLFLFERLKEYHSEPIRFLREIVIFLYESESVYPDRVNGERVLVKSLLVHAKPNLTFWAAWAKLILGDLLNERQQECALKVLVEIIHCIKQPSDKGVLGVEKKRELEMAIEEMQTEITIHLGQNMVKLLEKYKANDACLKNIFILLQQFNYTINTLDMKLIFSSFMQLNCCHGKLLLEWSSTLAFLFHIMSLSKKWKKFAKTFEKSILNHCANQFPRACEVIAESEKYPILIVEANMALAKKVYYLLLYFDMTDTYLLDGALEILQYAKKKRSSKIVSLVMPMCLLVVKWQLTRILENKLPEDELKARLYKIQSQTRTMLLQLDPLLRSIDLKVRKISYAVFSKLMVIFSPTNQYVAQYPMIHLPLPSLETCEWLNFNLFLSTPCDKIPEDATQYHQAYQSLKLFCSMLKAAVLHVTYISSILPYFALYKEEKNYNGILQGAMIPFMKKSEIISIIVKLLVFLRQKYRFERLKEISQGLAEVVVAQMKPINQVNEIALSIVAESVNFAQKLQDNSIFLIPTAFVKYLSKLHASCLFTHILNTFGVHVETDGHVKDFISAIEKNINNSVRRQRKK